MLNSDKAKKLLKWKPSYDIDKTLEESIEWYSSFIKNKDIVETSYYQYEKYMELQNE